MWNLNYDSELIYETETGAQTQKADQWLPKGWGSRRGMNWEFGINRYNYYTQDG